MDLRVWQLAGNKAQLRLEGLSASLDLEQPARGIHDIHPALDAAADFHILGIEVPAISDAGRDALVESYTRSIDLVAAYRETKEWPIQVDVRWQAVGNAGATGLLGAIDMVVSVRTDLLDSRPGLAVVSAVPPGEMLRLRDRQSGRFEPLEVDGTTRVVPQDGPGCLLFRPVLGDLSYVEMIHPADFDRDEIARGESPDAPISVRHRLFPQPLEKGVILRARVRGAILARSTDQELASALFAALSTADPPLGT